MRWLVGWSSAVARSSVVSGRAVVPLGAQQLWTGPDPLWAVGDWRSANRIYQNIVVIQFIVDQLFVGGECLSGQVGIFVITHLVDKKIVFGRAIGTGAMKDGGFAIGRHDKASIKAMCR